MIWGDSGGHIGFLKKPRDEILHTLQKLFSYAYMNSYQSLKKSVLHFHLIGKIMIFPPDYDVVFHL